MPSLSVHQRRDRADEVAHQRPAAQLFGPAGHGARPSPRRRAPARSPCTMPCRCLTVLAKPGCSSWSCARSPQSPALTVGHQKLTDEQRVLQARDGRQVGLRRRAPLAGVRSPPPRRRSRRWCRTVPPEPKVEVAGGVTGAEHEAARRQREAFQHQLARQAHQVALAVHAGACLLEQGERLGRLVAHAGALQHSKRGLLERREAGLAVEGHGEIAAPRCDGRAGRAQIVPARPPSGTSCSLIALRLHGCEQAVVALLHGCTLCGCRDGQQVAVAHRLAGAGCACRSARTRSR